CVPSIAIRFYRGSRQTEGPRLDTRSRTIERDSRLSGGPLRRTQNLVGFGSWGVRFPLPAPNLISTYATVVTTCSVCPFGQCLSRCHCGPRPGGRPPAADAREI